MFRLMAKLVLAGLLLAPWIVAPATAGDNARLRSLGFSNGGGYYAFIQEGIQDGSGLPYVELFVIDVASDSWVPGTPIRRRVPGDQMAAVEQAGAENVLPTLRQQVLDEAQPILDRYGIDQTRPGLTMAARGAYEPLDDSVSFSLLGANASPTLHVTIDQTPVPQESDRCWTGDAPRMMSLTLTRSDDGSVVGSHVLARDTALPESRGCPLEYGIARILVPSIVWNGDRPQPIVVIVALTSPGYEGPDLRYLAIGGTVSSLRDL